MFRGTIAPLALAYTFLLIGCDYQKYTMDTIEGDVQALAGPDAAAQKVQAAAAAPSGKFVPDLRAAVADAPEYKAAQSAALEAAKGVDMARSLRKVQLEANGNMGMIREEAPSATTITQGVSATFYLSKLLYDGGESVAQVDGAIAGAFAAQAQAREQGNSLARDAGSAWIDVWQFTARNRLLAERAGKARDLQVQMQGLVGGLIDVSVAKSAEIALRDLETEALRLQAEEADARARFARYFGTAPARLAQPPQLLTEADLAALPARWTEAPALQAAAAKVLVSQEEVNAAAARLKPTLGFRTGVNSPMSDTDSTDYVAGIEMRWVLGDGGRRRADVEARKARLTTDKETLEALKRKGRMELDIALSKRGSLRDSITMLRAQQTATSEENEILWSQLATGQASVRQLIDAEISAYRSVDRLLAAQAELARLDLELAAQAGLLLKKAGA